MKHTLLMLISAAALLAACNTQTPATKQGQPHKRRVGISLYTPGITSRFISLDTGNKMLTSYLNSISYVGNDTDLQSLIFNADSLRAYLSNPAIVSVKFMFAHTLDYINNGGSGQNAGYLSGELTLIVAGYDTLGNYVYYNYPESPVNMVLEHAMPCPASCPSVGTASNSLLAH